MLVDIITHLFIFWAIGFILTMLNEKWGQYWSMGLVYYIAWIITMPIRDWRHYSKYKVEYQKRGITRLKYMFDRKKRGNVQE